MKRGRPRKPGKNKRPLARDLIAQGWMHGGMVDDVNRKWRRKPLPPDEELALLAQVQDAVETLHGFYSVVFDTMRLTGCDSATATVAVLDVMGALVAGRAERGRKRGRGEKINRSPFNDPVFDAFYRLGLDFKRAPHRPKDSAAEVAKKLRLREQDGATDVRYYARHTL